MAPGPYTCQEVGLNMPATLHKRIHHGEGRQVGGPYGTETGTLGTTVTLCHCGQLSTQLPAVTAQKHAL